MRYILFKYKINNSIICEIILIDLSLLFNNRKITKIGYNFI